MRSIVSAIAGSLGLVVVAVALAAPFGFHVVRLATGSMAPEYPAGALLVVRDVDAREVVPGDVVTVARADGVPVTHRVVEAGSAGQGARLVLRGDANPAPDPAPYLATRVGLVLAGIPVGGEVVAALQRPAAAIALSVAAALVVLWSWWPRRAGPAHRREAEAPS